MKTFIIIITLIIAGTAVSQTFQNPLPAEQKFGDHEFDKWYFYILVDNSYVGDLDSVKYILFRTRDVWKTYEKQFMTDNYIRPVYRYSLFSSPHYTYYHLPWGHSMISHEQYFIIDQKTGCGIEYRTYSNL